MSEIRFWNRAEKREEIEKIYGDGLVKFLYGSRAGQTLSDRVFSRAFLSKTYGVYQASPLSRHKIRPFIEEFKIPMKDFEFAEYRSFNDFFIRKFRPGARTFVATPNLMPAFAEARYLAFESISQGETYPVKGEDLSAEKILGKNLSEFSGGPMLIARLCPVDYHRFHFPDDGKTLDSYQVGGKLHSVNPLALKFKSDIFATNERQISILETRNFGRLAYVEVGALCVGKIIQIHRQKEFHRCDEKGYFLFGASTIILMGEKGRWKPSSDLLEQTAGKRETFVRLGDVVAESLVDNSVR